MNTENKKIYIQNFWYVMNYGACLTAYALYTVLKNQGYDVELINLANFAEKLSYKFGGFIKKYCKTTKNMATSSDLAEIVDSKATYITGSDQVFRPFLSRDNFSKFLFDYVPCSKKIAVSASFGKDKDEFLQESGACVVVKMKDSLQSFDYISTREKQGVEICNKIFDINAQWIIDPVFILEKSYFEKLSDEGKQKNTNYIASCIFEKKNNKMYKLLSKKWGCRVIELHESGISIENWLKTIKNCKFLVTNSFHAMCFAIIFNKPFVALTKDTRASSRFESLFEMLGIENQSINSIDEICEKDCIFKIDYEKVNQKIEEERTRGFEFLKKALSAPVDKLNEKQRIQTRFLMETIHKLEQQANLKYQIKKELWNLWLIIYYKYLPNFVKNVIKKLRRKR